MGIEYKVIKRNPAYANGEPVAGGRRTRKHRFLYLPIKISRSVEAPWAAKQKGLCRLARPAVKELENEVAIVKKL